MPTGTAMGGGRGAKRALVMGARLNRSSSALRLTLAVPFDCDFLKFPKPPTGGIGDFCLTVYTSSQNTKNRKLW